MSEKEYTAKRDFAHTNEPPAGARFKRSNQPIFVIQKHDASNFHYDFRLEIDGTLKSWAVPKGPSLDPSEKRLAVPTEDHPVDYAFFEGTIPEEEYGGGTVMIWDRGSIESIKKEEGQTLSLSESYQRGTVEVWLKGEKLQGGFALIKMKGGQLKGKWLLTKMDDDRADARRKPLSTQKESVVSGRSLNEIEKEEDGS